MWNINGWWLEWDELNEEMIKQLAEWRNAGTPHYSLFESWGQDDDDDGLEECYYSHNSTYGIPSSVFGQAYNRMFRFALADPALRAGIRAEFKRMNSKDVPDESIEEVLSLSETPWIIPTQSELDDIQRKKGESPAMVSWPMERASKHPQKHWFSATSAAIRFLGDHPDARRHIRSIVIIEDRAAVADPYLHVHGLVPFCQENPLLRIERRLSLWTNVLASGIREFGEIHQRNYWEFEECDSNKMELGKEGLTKVLARWLVEANMAHVPDAITLVLDCESAPEAATTLFNEVVHRDVAWQTALVQSMDESDSRHGKLDRYVKSQTSPMRCYGFPEVIQDMVYNPKSRVRCNFDPGQPWEPARVAEILRANRDGDSRHWDNKWAEEVKKHTPEGPPRWTFNNLEAIYQYRDRPICGKHKVVH